MRLLFITQDFPPDVGGTQTYAVELARRLAARCDDFALLAPARPGMAAVDAALPFEVVRVRASSNTLPLRAAGPICALTRRRGFDAAFHVQWPTALATLLARPFGGPRRLFIAAHGRELLLAPLAAVPPLGWLYDGLRAGLLRRADALFPVSRYTGALLEACGVLPERQTVLPNGTDPGRFFPADAGALRHRLGLERQKVVLTVSRLVPRKGIDTVLRALPTVARAVPEVAYLIGGDGPDRARLAALAHDLGVADRVHFLGTVAPGNLNALYNACDVFVMPSREDRPHVEGFGIVFLEANACGKPVIGARAGGIPDAVRHGETGLLVEPDDADGLAEALGLLLLDDALAARLGRAGRARVLAEATWDHRARTLYDALEAHLCGSSSP